MVLAVMYKIDTSKKDYSAFFEKIKSFGPWMHYLDSCWLIGPSGDETPQTVYGELIPLIAGEKDYLLVFQLGRNWQGWLPRDANSWLNSQKYG